MSTLTFSVGGPDPFSFEIKGNIPNQEEAQRIVEILEREVPGTLTASKRKEILDMAQVVEVPTSARKEETDLSQERPAFAERLIPRDIEAFRPAAIGGGAAVGAVTAGPLAPIGAIGGAALASLGFDTIKELGRRTGLVGEGGIVQDLPTPPPFTGEAQPDTLAAQTTRALEEAALEGIFPGFVGIAGRFIRRNLQKLAVVGSDASKRIIGAAQELGIPIGIETATQGRVIRGARKIIGKFPLLAPGFREADQRVAGALATAKEQLLHDVAPVLTTTTRTGANLATAQVRRQKAIRGVFSKRYEDILTRAQDAGATVPTDRTREAAQDLVDVFGAELPQRRVIRETAEGIVESVEPIETITNQQVVDWSRDNLVNLTKTMTPRQYQRLSREFNALIDDVRDNPTLVRQATILKKALQDDLENTAGESFAQEFRDVNKDFSRWAALLKSPTGQRFGRASIGVFDAEISEGTRNADVLFKTFFDAKSPTAIKELRELVGFVPFRRAVRQHIDNAFTLAEESTKDGKFMNIASIRRNLGLGDPKSPEYETLKTALDLSGTKVSISDLEKFFRVAEAHFSLGVIDVSQFVARRAVLGGFRSAIRSFLPGASIVGGAGGAGGIAGGPLAAAAGIAAVFGFRRGSRMLTNPQMLKSATRALDDGTPPQAKRAATLRFLRLLAEDAARPEPAPATPELFTQPPPPGLGLLR